MREVLYRGKRIDNGEWTYGYLFVCWDRCYILWGMSGDNPIKEEVISETVGEYTGLTDKHGNKIFESDIVNLEDKSYGYQWKAVVEFGNPNGNYTWGWQLKPIGKAKNVNTDILCWVEMEETGAFCEIIGNKWDNPEILEVEQ